jgi:Spy/CpxP family protein refolding chaperone
MRRRSTIALALTALLLVPALAAARGPSPAEILHNPRLLARYLGLTEAQQAQAKPLFDTLATTLKSIAQQEKVQRDGLAAELDKPNPDACTAGGFVVKIHDLYEQTETALKTFDTAFSAILTPDQLAKYNALKQLVRLAQGPGT